MDETTGYAPYFREVLREDLKAILKGIKKPDGDTYDIYDDGLKIYTTINPACRNMQKKQLLNGCQPCKNG
jgi:penicillin-binding protein 1A